MDILRSWYQVNLFAAVLLVLIGFDILTGTLRALRDRSVSSTISRNGMFRKLGELVSIGLCAVLEMLLTGRYPQIDLVEPAAMILCVPELLSVTENLKLLGVPIVPDFLAQFFQRLKPFVQAAPAGVGSPAATDEQRQNGA